MLRRILAEPSLDRFGSPARALWSRSSTLLQVQGRDYTLRNYRLTFQMQASLT